MSTKTPLMAWLAYPTVMILAISLHLQLLNLAWAIHWAAYVPVMLGALAVTVLEHKFPHQTQWQPDRYDWGNDWVFMLLVQVLLPRFLSFFIAAALLAALQQYDWVLEGFWPHQWPIAAQAVLMLLTADLSRYWLHRAAHEWPPLWRLHTVHHSPKKLYWLNVGRFHPLDKSLQYLLDALPFIVLGVSEEVLALYFVFYAINGFFQHCNIELRLGVLNYLISGPELHRWHHSRIIGESNNNYGNNLIIWDIIFGTRFLPDGRQVEALGLINRSYPASFWTQMKTPFIKGLDKG